ncbi:MAG: hypothetical protein J6N56_01750 [Bacteroidales bacterium]|nr:hypothetical protein [Bacteroidales bacterium]MBQ1886983.1 hypothetical protein [Bacteroidales bacterium]
MEKKLKIIIGVLSAVILVLAGVLIAQLSKKTEIKETVQVLTVDKENLTDQLTQLQQDYANLSSTNDTINTQLQIEREKVAELIEKVKKTEASNSAQLRKYEKELGTLRSIMKSYIKQIDSLNQMNIALKEEVTEAKKQVQETEAKNEAQAKKIEEQSKKITEGSAIKGRGLSIVALNSRGKVMDRSSRAEQFRVSLSLVENSIAETGLMTVYVRIKDPDGILMTDGGQQVFSCNGEQLIYSASREVDYQGQELDMNIFFTPGAELSKGTYTVEAYTSKGKLGTAEVHLK